jgi:hypothetical protein
MQPKREITPRNNSVNTQQVHNSLVLDFERLNDLQAEHGAAPLRRSDAAKT